MKQLTDIFLNFIVLIFCLIIFFASQYCLKYYYYLKRLNKLLNNNNLFIVCDIPKKLQKLYSYLTTNIFDLDDSDGIINFLINNKNISLILDTDGGSIISNDIILNHIIESKLDLETYVIRKASSAGTLLALISDKLYMDENAYITPTDPQTSILNQNYSIKAIIELCDNKDKNLILDTNLLGYYELKKTYNENIKIMKKLLNNKFKNNISKKEKENILKQLTEGDISHHTPFNCRYLEKYLKINKDIPKIIYNIYDLYFYLIKY
jgi:ATP-dependent protease ClpP protease subunit